MLSLLVDLPFRVYRYLLSPFIHSIAGSPTACRFEPSCSRFAQEALAVHGPVHGGWLAVRRICRCHPFSSGGFDPVPRCGIASSRKVTANGP